LVDDSPAIAENLKEWFTATGHVFESVENGEDALQLLANFKFDIILLDWSMPGMTGPEVCATFRKNGGTTPIIFLTGKGDIESKEQGLDLGADDYIVKPYDVRELTARIRSILRRPHGLLPAELTISGVSLDPVARMVTANERSVHLRPKESALLEYLMRHPNIPVSTQALLDAVWPSEAEAAPHTVRAWIKYLRDKLKEIGCDDLIKTIKPTGYMIELAIGAEGQKSSSDQD